MSQRDTSDFWSRRKAAVRAEAKAEQAEKLRQADRADAAARRDAQAGMTDDEILQELGLPDPASLRAGDDFAAFLGKAVPEHLRRRALRQLWGSNPVLANIDGLVDYGEDFTAGSVAAGALKTVYQVGRGAVARLDNTATETPEVTVRSTDTPAGITACDTGGSEDAAPSPTPDNKGAIEPEAAADPADLPPVPPARPRHMQFTFSNEAAT